MTIEAARAAVEAAVEAEASGAATENREGTGRTACRAGRVGEAAGEGLTMTGHAGAGAGGALTTIVDRHAVGEGGVLTTTSVDRLVLARTTGPGRVGGEVAGEGTTLRTVRRAAACLRGGLGVTVRPKTTRPAPGGGVGGTTPTCRRLVGAMTGLGNVRA